MHLKSLLRRAAVACLAWAVMGAAPPSQPSYRIDLGQAPLGPDVIYPQLGMWIDTTNTGVNSYGQPTPISNQSPMPVSPKPQTVTFHAANASAIATPNVAVPVFLAGSVTNGFIIFNPPGNVVLYVDLVQTAAAGQPTSLPLQPGQQLVVPNPTTGAVSAVASQAQSFNSVSY